MAAPQHGFSRKDSIHGCPGRLTQLHYQCCTQHRSAQQHRTAHPAPHCGADTQDTTPGLPLQAQCNLPLPGLPQLLLLCPNIAFSSSSQPHPAPHLGTDKQDSTCGHLIRLVYLTSCSLCTIFNRCSHGPHSVAQQPAGSLWKPDTDDSADAGSHVGPAVGVPDRFQP